jgi:hypothetical protein
MILNSPTISGSLTVTGNIISSGSITLSGSVASASYAATASFVALAQSASNAVSAATASFANAFTVASTLTAQTLVVQTITSSVSFITGSTKFGSIIDNTHQFTGSLYITGSVGINAASSFRFNGVGDTSHAVGYDSTVDGAFLRGQNGVRFLTGTGGGTARMFISSSGNVGIGTSNPSTALHVAASTAPYIRIDDVGFGSENGITWQPSGFTSRGSLTVNYLTAEMRLSAGVSGATYFQTFYTNGAERMRITSGGSVGIGTSSPTSFGSTYSVLDLYNGGDGGFLLVRSPSVSGDFHADESVNNVNLGTRTNSNLVFRTNLTERMRITSGGFLKASNTGTYASSGGSMHELRSNSSQTLLATNANNVSGDLLFNCKLGANADNASSYFMVGETGGANRVFIYGNGNIVNTNNSYGPISDIKLKENIVDTTPKLDDLMKVRIVNYNLKSDLGYKSNKQIGVIAQELEQVFPGLVDEHIDKDSEGIDLGTTTKSVKMSVFVPMLIKAIQELKATNDDLQSQINELKAQ